MEEERERERERWEEEGGLEWRKIPPFPFPVGLRRGKGRKGASSKEKFGKEEDFLLIWDSPQKVTGSRKAGLQSFVLVNPIFFWPESPSELSVVKKEGESR